MAKKDFVDEMIEEFSADDPEFPQLLEAAKRRRAVVKKLAARREAIERSQTYVAAKMGSSQSSVARIESAASDLRLSTLDRYAKAVGCRIEYALVPEKAHQPKKLSQDPR